MQPRREEGDINFGDRRRRWQREHLDAATRQSLEADAAVFLHQSLSTPCLNVLERCAGIYLFDQQGRAIMDFHGNSAHQVGYGHPRVVEAIERQLRRLPFCPRRYANPTATALAQRLVSIAPDPLGKVLFAPAGTTAIGMALKIARYATGRHQTISMWGAFHGASLDAISIGGEPLFRDGLGPLLPGCHHVPRPRAGSTVDEAVGPIAALLERGGAIGAVIAEPVRCTTVEIPPRGYWQRVRELCDAHGALLVFDEIALGMGATGRMFCFEHFGVTPDLLVLGKGLGGGVMPLAAVLAWADLDVAPDRAVGHYTHEKSAVGAAAALAVIDVIEHENLLDQAEQLGRHAVERLRAVQRNCRLVADVRGLGLCIGVELRRDRVPATDEAERVMYECLERRGLSFKVSDGNVLTLTPPLTITREQLDRAIDILEDCLIGRCRADAKSF